MPKTLTVNVPVDGTVIIARRQRKFADPAQQDCFDNYRARWIIDMANFIRSFPRPVRMSQVRIEAGMRAMSTPLSPKWYGRAMQMAGLRIVGYDKSPIKSRRGGIEALWADK